VQSNLSECANEGSGDLKYFLLQVSSRFCNLTSTGDRYGELSRDVWIGGSLKSEVSFKSVSISSDYSNFSLDSVKLWNESLTERIFNLMRLSSFLLTRSYFYSRYLLLTPSRFDYFNYRLLRPVSSGRSYTSIKAWMSLFRAYLLTIAFVWILSTRSGVRTVFRDGIIIIYLLEDTPKSSSCIINSAGAFSLNITSRSVAVLGSEWFTGFLCFFNLIAGRFSEVAATICVPSNAASS